MKPLITSLLAKHCASKSLYNPLLHKSVPQPSAPRAQRGRAGFWHVSAMLLLLTALFTNPALAVDGDRYVALYAIEVDGEMQYNWAVYSLTVDGRQFRNLQGAFPYNRCVMTSEGDIESESGGLLYYVMNNGSKAYIRQNGNNWPGDIYFDFTTTSSPNCFFTMRVVNNELHRTNVCSGNSSPRCLAWRYSWPQGSTRNTVESGGDGSYLGWSAVNMIDDKKTYDSIPDYRKQVIYKLTTYQHRHLTAPVIASADGSMTHFVGTGSKQYTVGTASLCSNAEVYKLEGASTYYVIDGQLPSITPPTVGYSSEEITYEWLMADGQADDGHVRLLSDGTVVYYNSYPTATTRTLVLRAKQYELGLTADGTLDITFDALPMADPTSLSASNITMNPNNTITPTNYTLTSPSGTSPYTYVQVVSVGDDALVSYTNDAAAGSFQLTSLRLGSTSVTIRAYRQDGTALQDATFMVTVTPTAGHDGSVVTLNDLEDNTWAYYSDPSLPVRSLNPINACITYRGNGLVLDNSYSEATLAELTILNPSEHTVAATGVRVGLGSESEHTFVYYRTLERTNGRTATTMAEANSTAEYRVIPNPFAVRPTYDDGTTPSTLSATTAWKGWRGFLSWRIASLNGGTVRRADGSQCTIGSLLQGDELVYLQKSSSTLAENNIDIELELEAVWAPAYVGLLYDNAASDDLSHLNAAAGMERNFGIVLGNNINIGTRSGNNTPATWSGIFPNGTSDGITMATTVPTGRRITEDHNDLRCDTKLEYLRTLGSSMGISANYHNLVIGRGMMTDGTYVFKNVRGINDVSAIDRDYSWTVRVESGNYECVRVLQFNESVPNVNNHLFAARGVYGSDYDRAVGDNSKLIVEISMGGGAAVKNVAAANVKQLNFDYVVKSGTFLQNEKLNRTTTSRCAWVMYLSKWSSDVNTGRRRLLMEGGRLGGIGGGVDFDEGTWSNNYILNADCRDSVMVDIRIKGGELTREVYGGAENSPGAGQRRLVITGGTFYSWVAAGANANRANGNMGYVSGTTMVYFGGNAHLDNTNPLGLTGSRAGTTGLTGDKNSTEVQLANSIGYNAPAGCLFGAGVGSGTPNPTGNSSGKVDQSVVVVADNAVIDGDVYGGGYKGFCNTGATVRIKGGTVKGKVFGGSNSNVGGFVDLLMDGGKVFGGVYGGSNQSGAVAGPILVAIEGGEVGMESQDAETGHVFGCGYGEQTSVTGKVNVVIGRKEGSEIHADWPLLYGNAYCGGHNAAHTVAAGEDAFSIVAQNGKVMGSIFGGGKGITAVVVGNTNVLLRGSVEVMLNVYGGGELGNINGNTTVRLE